MTRKVDALEETARREPLFAQAMISVWLNAAVPQVVRHRLARFGARDFVAEHSMTRADFEHY